ncbi:MAG: hypothetical protein HYX54_02690 [Chloroflexi bacterium]|nr:hypothetical protein [Chloroflexota bacterium]
MLPTPTILNRLRAGRILAWLMAVLLAAACGPGSTTSFDPTGPCGVDGRAAGAYPDLEARLPATFEGTAPGSVDSGRHCSEAALGSLIVHDVSSVQFAGATWDLGGGTGISSAIFELPTGSLPADWIAEFYDIGSRTAKRTENIETSRPTMPGPGQVFRLDTLNDLSLQSVVVWQDGPLVRVVLVATTVAPDATRAAHDALVDRAVAATVAVVAEPSASG